MTHNLAKPAKVKKVKKHYIDNIKFSEEATKYVDLYNYNKEHNLEKPRLSEYLGESIILLAHKVANMPAFLSYSFRDEMILDAIEIAVRYFHNFDQNVISKRTGLKSAGAHSYFTQILANRMYKRRSDEKLQLFIKQKYIANSDDLFTELSEQDTENFTDEIKEILQGMSGDDFYVYDDKLEAKKLLLNNSKGETKPSKKKAKLALDAFLEYEE